MGAATPFKLTKGQFKPAMSKLLKSVALESLNEAALPAYTHTNSLIDWIFWGRLKVAEQFIRQRMSSGQLLDFGCGPGIFSQLMAQHGFLVTAIDLDLQPVKALESLVSYDPKVEFQLSEPNFNTWEGERFDVIVALDVLEHINDLDPYLQRFSELLRPGGLLVISGPTENFLYRLGRRIAGKQFSGHYHHSNIYHIKKQTQKYFKVMGQRKLIFPFTLFEVFIAIRPHPPVSDPSTNLKKNITTNTSAADAKG